MSVKEEVSMGADCMSAGDQAKCDVTSNYLLNTTKVLLLRLKILATICKSTAVALRLSLQAAFSHLRLLPKSPALGLLLKSPYRALWLLLKWPAVGLF